MDWPFEEGGNGATEQSILDYLAQNKFDMVINLPLRNTGSRRASSFITHGYRTRRMAIDYSIPLITDIKCAKLFIEVQNKIVVLIQLLHSHYTEILISQIPNRLGFLNLVISRTENHFPPPVKR